MHPAIEIEIRIRDIFLILTGIRGLLSNQKAPKTKTINNK